MDRSVMDRPGVQLMRLMRERHVPDKVAMEWLRKLPALPDQKARDAYLLQLIEKVKAEYSWVPVEDFLQQIEETQDWDEFLRYRSTYWKDLPSVLRDTVRLGAANTVRQHAPHVLFDNDALLEELLSLCPDGRTREALLDRSVLKPHAVYAAYPFCVQTHVVMDIHRKTRETPGFPKLLSCPADIQQRLFTLLKEKYAQGSEEKLAMLAARRPGREELDTEDEKETLSLRWLLDLLLFGIGCHWHGQGFVMKPLPQGWEHYEFNNGGEPYTQPVEAYRQGLSWMINCISEVGLDLKFDGINDSFGTTGYYYLSEWP